MKAQYGGGTITTCNQSKYPHMKVFKNLAYQNRQIQKFHAKFTQQFGQDRNSQFIFFKL
jgi:ABC-type sugar transport system ATPase subunit